MKCNPTISAYSAKPATKDPNPLFYPFYLLLLLYLFYPIHLIHLLYLLYLIFYIFAPLKF